MKIALVHDWLTGMRGGEKVLEVALRALPGRRAVHAGPRAGIGLAGHRAAAASTRRSSSACPASARYYRHYLPLFPAAIEQFDLDGSTWCSASSHCAAKSVVTPAGAPHVCYCLTPMRYAWDQFDAYFGPERVGAARQRG